MGAIILALALLGKSPLQREVTFIGPAQRLGPLLSTLSQDTGVPLTVSGAARNEVVLVHGSEVPLGELMDRLAGVTFSRWIEEGDGCRLVPDKALLRKAEEEDTARPGSSASCTLPTARPAIPIGWAPRRSRSPVRPRNACRPQPTTS